MKIGIQGIAGSYSEMTARDYINRQINDSMDQASKERMKQAYEVVEYSSFQETTDALIAESVDLIVVPVENSTTGAITKLLDQLRYKSVISIAEAYQPVSHNLWALKGSDLMAIKTVYSHPEALSQCSTFFARYPHIETKAHDDTAKASLHVKELNRLDVAAISSARAGKLYDLVPLLEDIQDESSNMTRFYILEKKRPEKKYTGEVLSFYIETRHEAGALLKVLQVFDIYNGNLLSLTARPIKHQAFTYGFFLEVMANKMTVSNEILIQTLEQVAEYVQLLGQFKPVQRPTKKYDK